MEGIENHACTQTIPDRIDVKVGFIFQAIF